MLCVAIVVVFVVWGWGELRYMAAVLAEAEARHEQALAGRLASLAAAEEAAGRAALESQAALAGLFNATRLEFLAKDRISTPVGFASRRG